MTIQQWRQWEEQWRQGKGTRMTFGVMDIENGKDMLGEFAEG